MTESERKTHKMTYGQVLDCTEAMRELSALKLPGLVALRVAQVIRQLDQHSRDFATARDLVLTSRGFSILPNGQAVAPKTLTTEEQAELNAEVMKVVSESVDVSYHTLAEGALAGNTISPLSLAQILWLFE